MTLKKDEALREASTERRMKRNHEINTRLTRDKKSRRKETLLREVKLNLFSGRIQKKTEENRHRRLISFIFVISLAFGISAPTQVKDVTFNVNEVINRVSPHHSQSPNAPSRVSDEGRFDQSLTPDLTGEFLIDTSIVYGQTLRRQEHPSIAFDGSNYLVVWQDRRNDVGDIYGARITQSGQILDAIGINIATATDPQWYPSVAFDGINYLVVWEDHRNDYSDIYGARVSQSGHVLDPNGIPISTALNYQDYPSIAFDGNNYLVIWQDHRRGYYNIYGTRVTPNGQVLEPDGIHIPLAQKTQSTPSVAFDGDNYLMVWQDKRNGDWDIYGARVTPTGQVLGSFAIPISTKSGTQGSPSVVFDDSNYFVVWHDNQNSSSQYDIYGIHVSKNGQIFENTNTAISIATGDQKSPSVIFDGTKYLVVWTDERSGRYEHDIYGARVLRNGYVLDTAGIPISTAAESQLSLSIAFGDTNYIVVWQDERRGFFYPDIYGARVLQSGQVLDTAGILISTTANFQSSPSITFDGTNYLIVWYDKRNDNDNIYGARVSQNGQILDLNGIPIITGELGPGLPSVAFDGTNYLVVWQTGDIFGARVSPNGRVLDTTVISISIASESQLVPSISFDGTNYFIVWQDYRSGINWDIYGTRVSQTGVALDPNGIPISTTANNQHSPSLAFDGTNYFIVWQDYRSGTYWDIYGTRLSQAGTVLDPNGFAISTTTREKTTPVIDFDGTNYLVVWHDWLSGNNSNIYGARISQAGSVLDPNGILISTNANNRYSPAIAFDGTDYLVIWTDYRSGVNFDIYGSKISQSGTVINYFPVSTQSGDQTTPALTHGTGDQLLITYSGWTDSINQRPVHTMRIWGKFYPFLGMEEERNTLDAKRLTPKIYPNPAKSVIRVRVPWASFTPNASRPTLKIFDVSGKLIKEHPSVTCNDRRIEISLKGISPGIYFLQFGKTIKKFLIVR